MAPHDDHSTQEGRAERASTCDGEAPPVDEPPASGGPAEPGGEQEHEPVEAPPASDAPAEPDTT